MTQPSVRSALDKLNFCWLLWFEPHRLCHDFFCYRVLMLALFLRQVHKGNGSGFQVLHGFEYFRPIELVETRNQAFDVIQLSVLAIFSNQEFANSLTPGNVPAYKKFVLLIEPLFQPQVRFVPWVIVTPNRFATSPSIFVCLTTVVAVARSTSGQRTQRSAGSARRIQCRSPPNIFCVPRSACRAGPDL
jgi:hypothetical protein